MREVGKARTRFPRAAALRAVGLVAPLAVLSTAMAQEAEKEPDLAGRVESRDYDFSMRLPAGWPRVDEKPPVLFRIVSPPGTLLDGAMWMEYQEPRQPTPLSTVIEEFLKNAPRAYPGFEKLSDRRQPIGGYPAYACTFHVQSVQEGGGKKDLIMVRFFVQRQLTEYFMFNAIAERKDKDRLVKVAEQTMATFGAGPPLQPAQRESLRRAADVLREASLEPGILGERWHAIHVGGRKLGYQRTRCRRDTVEGRTVYAFELEMVLEDREGGRRTSTSRGLCAIDGSYQKIDHELVLEVPGAPRSVFKEEAVLAQGAFSASREVSGQKSEKKFNAPEATFLADAGYILARHFVLAKPTTYAMRVLKPFSDLPMLEIFETHAPGRVRTADGEQELIQALVRKGRFEYEEYLFDTSGCLYQQKAAKGLFVLRRCTEEEAKKKP
ncbi:MAG: hypothetical protein HY716_00490 [Planctomycetes bacterium]|nr:hypothetical protein [Planctomycetota bacterium]